MPSRARYLEASSRASSFPLIRPAHTNLQIRLSDQVTLAVAANNPITCKKDDPFDTMRLLCCAGAAESRLTHAQNPAFKHRLLLLHTGKVQTRGRERRECRKKEKEKEEDGEERMRNWNMIAEPATSGERWTWDWGTGVTESLPTNRGNNPPLPSLHLLWYDVMWVALLILFNYLLWLFIYLFIYILYIFLSHPLCALHYI